MQANSFNADQDVQTFLQGLRTLLIVLKREAAEGEAMPKAALVTHPDLSSRPFRMTAERMMAASPHVLFQVWTTEQFER
jgi:hypothetical protein